MSVRRLAEVQPEDFVFTLQNADWAKLQINKYPEGRQASAVIPLLWQAQKQHGGWLPEPAMVHVAEMLGMSRIRVLEVATFYTMFNLSPVGRHHIQLCGTTPCWLRGSDDLKLVCQRVIGDQGHITEDGALSWIEVECLGACCNAPMAQINDHYYEDLSADSFEQLLSDLRVGREARTGSLRGRTSSEPTGVLTSLTDCDVEGSWLQRDKPGLAIASTQVSDDTASLLVKDKEGAAPSGDVVGENHGSEPKRLKEPPADGRDVLTSIKGIGPKIEKILHELGIYKFSQIAEWTPDNVSWVTKRLKFRDRIVREEWIVQAKGFVAGNEDG
jgi:NADH-quinone oxidoreductase subunit E